MNPLSHYPCLVRGCFFGAAICVVVSSTAAQAAPYRPASPAQVLAEFPAALTRSAPRNLKTPNLSPQQASILAQRYIMQSRQDGDPRGLGYAQGVLSPWWALEQPPLPVLLMRATIRQSRHDFNGALADLKSLLKQTPDNAQAWLTQATVLRVLGRYPEAAQSCAQLQALASLFVSELCRLSVAGLSGELPASYSAMSALAGPAQTPGLQAWWQSELADMAERMNRPVVAETHYRKGLVADAQDHHLRAAYADLLLSQKRADEALALVQNHDRIDALRLRHALALSALNDPSFASLDTLIRDGFDAARRRGETLHLREEALYTLDAVGDALQALRLAQQNWSVQREPVDALLLVRAAHAVKQTTAAQPVLDWMSSSRLQDARLAGLLP